MFIVTDLVSLTNSKTCLKRPLIKNTKIGFQYQLSLNAGQKYCRILQWEHSAIHFTYIKLPFVFKTFVLSIFKWSLKMVLLYMHKDMLYACMHSYLVGTEEAKILA